MSALNRRTRKGQLVANALSGAWRSDQILDFELTSEELDEVTPLLYGSGAAALGWWRVRSTNVAETPSGAVLHQAYRLLALQAAIHEQKIEKLFRLLRQAGVEAVLAKGLAVARLYPESGLRPYGDIDILVDPGQIRAAERVVNADEAKDCQVDLHKNFSELSDRKLDQLFSRSSLVPLGDEKVRVLSCEDHLALLSVHLLKHGAWRPLWLCDVGVMIENLPPSFAWDVCLGSDVKRAGWITTAIGLAHLLLKARINAVPMARKVTELPRWLTEGVLKQWAAPFAINQPPMNHSAPMAHYLRRPQGIFTALRERWPNPILATVSVNGEFNDLPRLPYQIGNWALRSGQFLQQLPNRLRAQGQPSQ